VARVELGEFSPFAYLVYFRLSIVAADFIGRKQITAVRTRFSVPEVEKSKIPDSSTKIKSGLLWNIFLRIIGLALCVNNNLKV